MVTSCEVQAVVMAGGKGSRMTELTAKRPKCLLPVGNLPMIYYPLDLLEKSRFQDAIVVVQEAAKNEIQSAIDRSGLKIKCDLVAIPSGEEWGTADSLRYLEENNKIKMDVLVISCDLITNISLSPLLEMYRKHNAAITAVYVKTQNVDSSLPTPGPKTKNKLERDFVGIHPETSRLVLLASASDYEEELPINSSLIKKYGKFTIHSKLLDAHVYIISKWLCQYLVQNRTLSTLKGELLPYVVKKHLSSLNKNVKVEDKASIVGMDLKTELSQFAQESDLTSKIRQMSCFTDTRCEPVYNGDLIRCYASVYEGNFAIRANSIQQYCLANRNVLDKWNEIMVGKELVPVSSSAVVNSTQVGTDCIIADKATIAEKTSLKSSMVGIGAVVNSKTSVKDSILMAGATIEEGCSIENCIICEQSMVGANSKLKDCVVGSHHKVQPGSKHANEVLTDVDRLMEI